MHPALVRAAQQVEVAVAVPVDHEGIAVIIDAQGLAIGLDFFGFWQELTFALPLEEIEGAGKIADDQIEVTVTVPVYSERAGAGVLIRRLTFRGDDERFAVRPLQDFCPAKSPIFFAVQDLKHSRPVHLLLLEGIRTGKDVATSVAVEVHQLWSRAGASPHARHHGRQAIGHEPLRSREVALAKILVDLDPPAELPDE